MTSSAPKFRSYWRARCWVITVAVLAVGLGVGVLHLLPDGSWESRVSALPVIGLVLATAVLPLLGFPVTVVYLAVGGRFGVLGGLAVVAVCTLVHLLISFGLAHWAAPSLRRLFAVCGWRLPQARGDAVWPFACWMALLPAVSYTLKNLVAPCAGLPLRIYLGAFFPIHLAHAVVGLALGGVTIHFSWGLAAFVLAYAVALFALTRILVRRIRHAAPDRRPRAALMLRTDPGL